MKELPGSNVGKKSNQAGLKSRVFWTWVLGVGTPLAWIVLRVSLGWSVYGLPLDIALVVVWLLNAYWAGALVLRFARSRQWDRALPMSILPALFAASVMAPHPFLYTVNDVGDELHFLAMRSTYLKEVRALPRTDEPRLVEFDLGGMIWTHGAILYDESDELSLPPGQRSLAWHDRASKIDCCEPDADPPLFLQWTGLARHFYLASFPC